MIYIYDTVLYKDTSNVISPPVTNATDLADFTSVGLPTVLKVNDLSINDNYAEIDLSYTQFKALVVSPILWSDVKCKETVTMYELHLLSDTPL